MERPPSDSLEPGPKVRLFAPARHQKRHDMTRTWRSGNIKSAELASPDHLPTCGRCGDIAEVGDERCRGCNGRLYPPGVKAPRMVAVEQPPTDGPEPVVVQLLDAKEWRETHLRFCPTCDTDTMPLHTGRCAFCDTHLGGGDTAPAPPAEVPGCCRWCGERMDHQPYAGIRKYCSEKCKQAYWVRYTVAGRRWLAKHGRKTAA